MQEESGQDALLTARAEAQAAPHSRPASRRVVVVAGLAEPGRAARRSGVLLSQLYAECDIRRVYELSEGSRNSFELLKRPAGLAPTARAPSLRERRAAIGPQTSISGAA